MSDKDTAIVPRLQDYLSGTVAPEVEDPQLAQQRVVEQILRAETLEEVFDSGGSTAAGQFVGIPFTLANVRVMESRIADALPVYVLLEGTTIADAQPVLLNSGSPRVMAQAYRAQELGLLPLDVQVVEVAQAQPGKSAPIGLATL
jgi:hypothetical protein